jgi:nitrate/TMAO reductase-like tetraheme cytochrome c subunit
MIVVPVLAVLMVAGLGSAEYYTARPAFCGSCHIMDPYYQSWSHDIHGAKLGARCVDCHYAPGEQHTIKAKFKGLSQVASYFSGRAGASRPRAHVNNASCLTSKCHGDGAYLSKPLLVGSPRVEMRVIGTQENKVERTPTVTFVHEKHLRISAKQAEVETQIDKVEQRLQAAVAPEALTRILAAARSVGPAAEKTLEMRTTLRDLHLLDRLDDAMELRRLEHLLTRYRQLAGLNCAACHSYDASGMQHVMSADLVTCFTCHFNDEGFNRGTGECLKCHEPPVRKILIHDQPVDLLWKQPGAPTSVPASGPVLMDHRDIVARGVNCASCHLDVVQGQATVTARECTHCHDQARYLEGFEQRDTEKVAEYHRIHVAAQRARCVDCHRAIQHHLIDPTHVGTSAGFLQPVLNDCQHCHPNHHHEQVELLMGIGGEGVGRPMPNAMFGSRLNCQACHTKPGTDFKGDALIKATEATCLACHGSDYERLFEQWRAELATSLKETEAALARVDEQVKLLKASGKELPPDLAKLVEEARANTQFIRAGNGIHNKNYSLELLDQSLRNLDRVLNTFITP